MNNLFLSHIPKDILFSIKTMHFDAPTPECENEIDQLLKKTVLIGGKRLRPLLTLVMGRLFNLKNSELKDYAQAIEFVHAASLAHDDVVDNATIRRGHPSINHVAGNKKAVLAGDYLLSNVIVNLSNKGNIEVLKKTAEVISQLAKGEWIQHDACNSKTYTREIILNIAKFKTASVMSWCCVIPSLIIGTDQKIINWCNSFGENLGIAFQQIDDTLDFSDDSQKDFLLDFQNGVVNSVLFEWMEINTVLKEDFKNNTIGDIFLYDGMELAIGKVQESAQERLNDCYGLLDLICDSLLEKEYNPKEIKSSKNSIKSIIDFISQRSY